LPDLQVPIGSFATRLNKFAAECKLSEEDAHSLKAEVIRYVLKLLSRKGTLSIRAFAKKHNFLGEFTHFRDQYLSISQYVHRTLWVKVLEFYNEQKVPEDALVLSDVQFCLEHLNKEDLKKLKTQKVNPALNIDHIQIDQNWQIGGKKKKNTLKDFIKSKTGTLQYLNQYDGAVTQEDFQQEIACEVLRVANIYPKLNQQITDDTSIEDKLQRYISVSVNNKVLSIKEHYDHPSRRRVVSTIEPLYKEMKKFKRFQANARRAEAKVCQVNNLEYHWLVLELVRRFPTTKWDGLSVDTLRIEYKKARVSEMKDPLEIKDFFDNEVFDLSEPGFYANKVCNVPYRSREYMRQLTLLREQIRNSDSDYHSTVTTIVSDEEIGDGEEGVCADALKDPHDGKAYECVEDKIWIDSICSKIDDPKIARFVQIISGREDKDFETWAASNQHSISDFEDLLKGAKKYLKVSQSKLQSSRSLSKIIREVWDGTRKKTQVKQQSRSSKRDCKRDSESIERSFDCPDDFGIQELEGGGEAEERGFGFGGHAQNGSRPYD